MMDQTRTGAAMDGRQEGGKIVLLTHNTPYGRHMAQRLAARGVLVATLVFQRPPAPRLSLLRRIKRKAARMLRRPDKSASALDAAEAPFKVRADAFFREQAGDDPGWPDGIDVTIVDNVNAPETVDWLSGRAPDLLVVAGGPILRAPILSVPRLGAINLHSSLLPAYRGTFVEFWQVHDDALDTAGVTVHRVDAGVDTGAILVQCPTGPEAGQDPWHLRARNQIAALEVLPETAMQVLSGAAAERPQPEGGRAFRAQDMTEQARRRVLERIGAQ